jgi:hypothetical protein
VSFNPWKIEALSQACVDREEPIAPDSIALADIARECEIVRIENQLRIAE